MPDTRMERSARQIFDADGATVARPLDGERVLDLAYVRTGPRSDLPIVVVPGGPGMGSLVPYPGLRRDATRRGMDLVMVEHRGVGLSRTDRDGADLRDSDVTLEAAADDIAAVLDAEGVSRAVVYGASYGTYLAQLLAVRRPERIAALVLDSPMLDPVEDLAENRAHRRRLLWDGEDPSTAALAADVRALAETRPQNEVAHVVQVVHEFAGPQVLHRFARAWLAGRLEWLWRSILGMGRAEVEGAGMRYIMEPDLVAEISYGELGYGLPPDGGPLDPQLFFADAATRMPPFRGAPVDLRSEVPRYSWPTIVVSGERDLRTPPPVARRLAELAPRGVFVPLARTGHSALDTHRRAALAIAHAVATGHADRIPARAADLAALPRRGPSGHLGTALTALARLTTRG